MHYLVAIFGIVLGTAAAILILPHNYYDAGQLRLSAILLATGLLSGPMVSSLMDLRGWLRAESVMMIGLVYWLLTELFYPDYTANQLSRDAVVRAFFYIGLFAACIQLGSAAAYRWHGQHFKQRPAREDFSPDWLFGALIICSILGLMARLIPCQFSTDCVIEGLFGSRQIGPWTLGAGSGASNSALVTHLNYFGYLSLPLTVALHHRLGRINLRVLIGLALTVFFMLFLIKDGGRRLVGMVAGSGLLTWLLLRPRLGLREIAIGGLAGLMLLAMMEMMMTFRLADGGVVGSLFSGQAFERNPLKGGVRVDNNFNSMVRVMDLIPEFAPHTGWDAVIYWIVRPIPRSLWPNKPINPGIDIPQEFGERWSDGYTMTLSAIGDWYIAFGIWSLIIAALCTGYLGCRLVMAWFKPNLRDTVLYSLGAMCMFIGLRSYLELILMSYPIMALLLVERLTSRSGRIKPGAPQALRA